MGEMTLANAKLIMSVVAKRQHELLKSGMSKQDARLKAIEETGQSTYSQASRTCGRLGNQKC